MSSVKLKLTITDEQVIEMLRKHRWPRTIKCPYCNSKRINKNGKSPRKPYVQRYICKSCGRQFSDTTSTPFAQTELPPSEVLTIAYLYLKLGMSQLAVCRELGRSKKAIRRTVKLFGKAIENWFRLLKAEK